MRVLAEAFARSFLRGCRPRLGGGCTAALGYLVPSGGSVPETDGIAGQPILDTAGLA